VQSGKLLGLFLTLIYSLISVVRYSDAQIALELVAVTHNIVRRRSSPPLDDLVPFSSTDAAQFISRSLAPAAHVDASSLKKQCSWNITDEVYHVAAVCNVRLSKDFFCSLSECRIVRLSASDSHHLPSEILRAVYR